MDNYFAMLLQIQPVLPKGRDTLPNLENGDLSKEDEAVYDNRTERDPVQEEEKPYDNNAFVDVNLGE